MTEQSLSLSESVVLGNNTGQTVGNSCPGLNETRVELDLNMMGCRPYLEREDLMQAQRMPGPRIDPLKYRAHEVPLAPPLPNPDGVHYLDGIPAPDRGQTYPWPHPEEPDET